MEIALQAHESTTSPCLITPVYLAFGGIVKHVASLFNQKHCLLFVFLDSYTVPTLYYILCFVQVLNYSGTLKIESMLVCINPIA